MNMQVSVETTQGLERRMTVTVPRERIDGEVDKRLKSLAKKVKIKGFRPGKAPFNVVRQQYGGEVVHEVTGEVMQSSFVDAIKQENLRPAGTPYIEPAAAKGEGLEFTATFEVYPEVELKGLDTIEVERPQVEITDDDVDKIIESLRRQRKQWVDVDRAAQDGDQVIVDFVGTIDGEEFQGGTGNDVDVELGRKRMIPGLEEQLVGTKAGDKLNIAVTFPEDYPAGELAGKPAEFATEVKAVKEAKLPEVDEEFMSAYGIKEGGLEALRQQVRENLQREAEQTIDSRLKSQVFDGLVNLQLVELPKVLVDQEIQSLMEQHRQYQVQYGGAGRAPEQQDPADYEEQAQRRVALGLLLGEVIKANEIKVTPARLREEVEKLAAGYEDAAAVVKHFYSDKQRLDQVETSALEQLAVEWLLDQVKVADKTMSFDDLMNPGQTAS